MTGYSHGIDVSAYQGTQDWEQHKRGGITFAFAKASEGQSTRDPRFAAHIAGIKAAGLIPGAYHFAWPTQDATREAANYVAAVRPSAGRGFCHWLDLERYSDGRNYRGRTAAQIRAYAAAWVAAVERAFPGQRVGIYTSASDIAAGHVPSGVPLWYPAYPGASCDTYAEAEKHDRPKPGGRGVTVWQFTSTPVDRSIAYLSPAALREWAGAAPRTAPKVVDLSNVVAAAKRDPAAAQGHQTHAADVRIVEAALKAEGLLSSKYAGDGSFGSTTVTAYARWQRICGYHGKAADGIPGKTSLTRLGARHGFTVKA